MIAGPRVGSSIIRSVISSVVLAGFAIHSFLLYAIEPPPEVFYARVSRVYPLAKAIGRRIRFTTDLYLIRKFAIECVQRTALCLSTALTN